MKKSKHPKRNILSLSLMAMSTYSFALDSSIHQPEGGTLVVENKLIDDSDPNYVYTESNINTFIIAGHFTNKVGNVNLELNNVTIDSINTPINNGIQVGSGSNDASLNIHLKDNTISIQKDSNDGGLLGINVLTTGLGDVNQTLVLENSSINLDVKSSYPYSTVTGISMEAGGFNYALADTDLTFKGQYDINVKNTGIATGIRINAKDLNLTDDKTKGSSINVTGTDKVTGIYTFGSAVTTNISADINVLSNGFGEAIGIEANGGTGENVLVSNGNITVGHDGSSASMHFNAYGIKYAYYGDRHLSITNNGNISVEGITQTNGMDVSSYAGGEVINNGSINISAVSDGIGIKGVFADDFYNLSADAMIYNKEIIFHDVAGQANNNKGIYAEIYNGATLNVVSDTITNSDVGIYTQTEGQSTSNITVTNQITSNSIGILAAQGAHNITLKEGAFVQGGNKEFDNQYYSPSGLLGATGILLQPSIADVRNTINLEKGSKLYSLNDMAIYQMDSGLASITTINNAGTITGQIDISSVDATTILNNQVGGTLELQNYASGSKDEVMFHLSGANSVLNNDGLIKFTDQDASDTTTLSHATFNVATFKNNSGVIDLTTKNDGSNNLVGDTVTINGQYVSNGGLIKINSELNGDDSASDQLIVNGDVVLGSGATLLYVVPTLGSLGVKTTGDGIKTVSVSGTSDAQAFALKSPVTAGAYEYVLNKGQADENWYLTNVLRPIDPTEPEVVLRNPSTSAYLANQTAASALFMHSLFDRQSSAAVTNENTQDSSVWMYASTSNTKNSSINNAMNVDTDSNLLHLGADIAKWPVQNGNLHLGLMGAYGETESDVRSKITSSTSKGKVTGYSVGVYGTWFADQEKGKGLYVDSWAQYGWYKNKVTGAGQVNMEEKYDSNNWVVSLEAGYGMHLLTQSNTEVMFTPQVQVAYNHYKADDHQDGNGLKVSDSKAKDVVTRVGARLHAKTADDYAVIPYLEMNWLHNTAKNELSFNGEVLKDGVPKDRAEAKLGLQGSIGKNWQIWGQVSTQWGGNDYIRNEGQIGINYRW